MADIKIKGLSDLQKFLDQLPVKMEKNIMRSAMRAAAKVVKDEAYRLVPVDKGDLRSSLKISTRSSRGVVRASVTTTLFYEKFVEYGTASHWIKVREEDLPKRKTRRGSKTISLRTANKMAASGSLRIGANFVGAAVLHPGAKPHPFLRPALDTKATEAVLAAAEQIKKRLTKSGLNAAGVEVAADDE